MIQADTLNKMSLVQCYGEEGEIGLTLLDEKLSAFWHAPQTAKAKRKAQRPQWVLEVAGKLNIKKPNLIVIEAIDQWFMSQTSLVELLNKAIAGQTRIILTPAKIKSPLDDLPPLDEFDLKQIEDHAKSLGIDKKTRLKVEKERKKAKEEQAATKTEAVSSASNDEPPEFKTKHDAYEFLRKERKMSWKHAIAAVARGEVTVGRERVENAPSIPIVSPPKIETKVLEPNKIEVKVEEVKVEEVKVFTEGTVKALGKSFISKSEAYKWLREEKKMSWKQAIATVAAEAGGGAIASLVSITDL